MNWQPCGSGEAEQPNALTVLVELHRRQEGVTAGVKEVLAKAVEPDAGPLRAVEGLVADLLSVSVDMAPLIEVALGATAQHVVARPNGDLMEYPPGERDAAFGGRVGPSALGARRRGAASAAEIDLTGQPGVVGRSDSFVKVEPHYAALVARLLGRTWIVETLDRALSLAGTHSGQINGLNFVTLAGDHLQADGTLVVGPRQGASGLISRRSQLRELHEQLAALDERIVAGEANVQEMQTAIAQRQQELDGHSAAHRQATEAMAEHRVKLTTAEERRTQFQQQRAAQEGELRAASVQHDAAVARLAESREKRSRHETGLTEMDTRLTGLQQQIARHEVERQSRTRETTESKVELAKSEERLRNLRSRLRQFEDSRQERGRAIDEGRLQLELCVQRAEASH